MSMSVESHDTRVPKDTRTKVVARLWLALIFTLAVALILIFPETAAGRQFIALYKKPFFWAMCCLIIFQFVGAGFYAFMYPQNRKSIRNRLLLAFLSLLILPSMVFGLQSDMTRMFGQTGIAVQQCFGPAAVSFQSAAIPQLACLEAWNTPYAIVERRKIAEFGQKECLRQEDDKISGSIDRAMSQFNAFDSKDKILAAFRENNVPLETSDGQSYFANLHTHCLDGSGFDKNAQFKVVVLASFTAGSLLRDVTVSSSNASSYTTAFAKNGIADSYHIDFESRRRVTSAGQSLADMFTGKLKSSSGAPGDVSLSNLSFSCTDISGSCSADATLTGTLLNRTSSGIRSVAIAWGVNRNGRCDQSMTEPRIVSFSGNDILHEREQRSFAIPIQVPGSIAPKDAADICGTVIRVDS